jgi:micrococcal nuclease
MGRIIESRLETIKLPAITIKIEPTITPVNRQKTKVIRVVDGDTIEIEGGVKVRYIGMNTPETVDPRKPIQCFGKEASMENKTLVEGKEVELEKDISNTDKYGRLLRYVWLNGIMINEILVKEGYARVDTVPPDVKYSNIFLTAENESRTNNLGLWKKCQ